MCPAQCSHKTEGVFSLLPSLHLLLNDFINAALPPPPEQRPYAMHPCTLQYLELCWAQSRHFTKTDYLGGGVDLLSVPRLTGAW